MVTRLSAVDDHEAGNHVTRRAHAQTSQLRNDAQHTHCCASATAAIDTPDIVRELAASYAKTQKPAMHNITYSAAVEVSSRAWLCWHACIPQGSGRA